mgnify:CR=1 FL=1
MTLMLSSELLTCHPLVLPSKQVTYDLQKQVKKQVVLEDLGLLKKMHTNELLGG